MSKMIKHGYSEPSGNCCRKERERVIGKLMKYYPRTNESLEAILIDLKVMHEELQRRNAQ